MGFELNPTTGVIVDLFGPTAEFLMLPDDPGSDFCMIKGIIPPGAFVPLHSHADTEEFLVLEGTAEGLRHDANGYSWVEAKAGDHVHVPSGVRHAWRNLTEKPVVVLLLTTKKMGSFFLEIGRPIEHASQPPTPEDLAHFAAVSGRYGYWDATPEENAAVGIPMSF